MIESSETPYSIDKSKAAVHKRCARLRFDASFRSAGIKDVRSHPSDYLLSRADITRASGSILPARLAACFSPGESLSLSFEPVLCVVGALCLSIDIPDPVLEAFDQDESSDRTDAGFSDGFMVV